MIKMVVGVKATVAGKGEVWIEMETRNQPQTSLYLPSWLLTPRATSSLNGDFSSVALTPPPPMRVNAQVRSYGKTPVLGKKMKA